jgi:hypothetical protein
MITRSFTRSVCVAQMLQLHNLQPTHNNSNSNLCLSLHHYHPSLVPSQIKGTTTILRSLRLGTKARTVRLFCTASY